MTRKHRKGDLSSKNPEDFLGKPALGPHLKLAPLALIWVIGQYLYQIRACLTMLILTNLRFSLEKLVLSIFVSRYFKAVFREGF